MKTKTAKRLFKGFDDSRPALTNLNIKKNYMEFCDGFKLIRFMEDNETTGFLNMEELELTKAFPDSYLDTKSGFRNISLKKDVVLDLKSKDDVTSYPDTDLIYNTKVEVKAKIKLNVKHLIDICEILKSEYGKTDGLGLTLEIGKENEAVKGYCNNVKILLMPMRID